MQYISGTTVWFIYALSRSFSGQWAATELIIENLIKKGWHCRRITLPTLDRAISNSLLRYYGFLSELLCSWLKFSSLLFVNTPVIYVNLGQSMASFLRMWLPYMFVCRIRSDKKIVISLHGNVFMTWKPEQIETKFFNT